ncbi:hypothetical protein AB0F07_23805 [Streptomyces fructofermentans]|uniref:hypothetical protein n=1 Tax=Streptomyces fructofermentans TaxID=152141 RepID=UPI0033D6F6E2
MWWLKARRGSVMLPIAWVLYAGLLLAVQDSVVILPSVIGAADVVLSLFVPVPVLALLMYCLESRLRFAEISGVRNVGARDAALSATAAVGALLLSAAIGMLVHFPDAVAVGRNTFFLVGLMLCARPFCKDYAVMIPVTWLLSIVFLGFKKNREPQAWAINLQSTESWVSATISLLALLAGLLVQLRTSRRIS